MAADQNISTVRRLYAEAFNQGDFSHLDLIVTPDFHNHTAPPNAPRGPEELRGLITMLRTAFPDATYDIEDIFATDERVAVRVTLRGTHRGPLFGIPPTGRSFIQEQMHIMRMEDGRIAEHWGCRDDLGLMRQLGVIPEPAANAAR
jgi:steroid delta-isomerase-like uncharacterized protein